MRCGAEPKKKKEEVNRTFSKDQHTDEAQFNRTLKNHPMLDPVSHIFARYQTLPTVQQLHV